MKLLLLFFLFCAKIAYPLDYSESKNFVEVEIIPQNGLFKIKDDYYFGIKFSLQDGWKTYWKNPGDAGLPLKLRWKDSSKLIDHEILFPFPERYLEKGVRTIGYENDIIFPIKIRPTTLAAFKSSLVLDFLVCREVCIPVSEVKEISLDFGNIVKSKEFIQSLNKVPLKDKGTFQIIKKEIRKENKLSFQVKDYPSNKGHIEVFGYSQETDVKVEEIKDERNSIFLLNFGDKLENLNKPIFISISDGKKREEISLVIDKNKKSTNLLYYLFLAFVGGLILNFMPCVLPILSLKLYSFVSLPRENFNKIRLNCISTIAGIVCSFLFLSALVIISREFGQTMGWGFQFQNIYFLGCITLIIFFFSLNLLGFFEIILPKEILSKVNSWLNIKGLKGYFFSGAFATLLATPCSAPFLGTAIGFSMLASNTNIIIIFVSISIGFATPYLCFLFFPQLIFFFPKPGERMINLRFSLGLLLFLTSIWLMNLLEVYIFIIILATVSILYASYVKKKNSFKKLVTFICFLIIIISYSKKLYYNNDGIVWQKFHKESLETYIQSGKTVLVDVTADWCVTCQVNKLTTLDSNKLRDYVKLNNIITMRGDWTRNDIEILDFIKQFNRYGIPVNVVFGPNNKQGILLHEIITNDMLIDKLFIAGFNGN